MFSRLRGTYLRFYPALLIITIIAENISIILSSKYRIFNTSIVYNIFIFLQIIFILGFYLVETKKNLMFRLYAGFIVTFILFAITNMFFIQKIYEFNQLTYLLGSLFIIVSSCIFLYQLIEQIEDESLFTNSFFWITISNLIFFTGTFFYFLFWYYLVKKNVDNGNLFRSLLTILNIVFYTLIIIGFLCRKKSLR